MGRSGCRFGSPIPWPHSFPSDLRSGGRILCPEPLTPHAIEAIRFPDPSDTPPGAPETNARTSSGLARNRCSVHPEALVHLRQLRPVELLDRLVLTRIRTKVDTALIPAILIAPNLDAGFLLAKRKSGYVHPPVRVFPVEC